MHICVVGLCTVDAYSLLGDGYLNKIGQGLAAVNLVDSFLWVGGVARNGVLAWNGGGQTPVCEYV